MPNVPVAVLPLASFTMTEKPDVPSALGVPVKFPFVLSVSPAGRVPVVKLQS